jgi:deoxyribonuclease V
VKLAPDYSIHVEQWTATQEDLRRRLIVAPLRPLPRFVAGTDAAFFDEQQAVCAAAVVYDCQRQNIVDVSHAVQCLRAPYIPGYLSFREGDVALEAIMKLHHKFGAILFDGHGYAHPRRCGIASHLALLLDIPGVGVAKSRLIGTYGSLGETAGSSAPLMDGQEQIGLVLRTHSNVKPVFVSVAHRVDLASAKELVLACCIGHRLPEPTRQADIEVAKLKRGNLLTGSLIRDSNC